MPQGKEQSDYLHYLQHNDIDIDFWEEVPRQGPVTIMVGMIKYVTLTTEFLKREIRFEVIKDDMDTDIQEELSRIMSRKAFNIDDFNTLEDIESELTLWASQCPSGLTCRRYSIGTTFAGNNIYAFSMSTGSGRQAAWFDSTIHAREWLATATNLKLMNWFITGYGSNADVNSILNSYDLYFVAVNNPDGFAYTIIDRLWRKNRATNPGSTCLGTDLNRNFDWRWGREGVSTNPCAATFCGSRGNSELETIAVVNEVTRINNAQTMIALVTFHSYGQMWMHPWGNTEFHIGATCEHATDHADMLAVAVATANAVENTYGSRWARGTSCDVIYATTGATDDWAKGVPQVKYPFNPELRGNNFVVSPNQIDPSFQEVRNGVIAMFGAIAVQEAKTN